MKKRLLALMLALVTVAALFAGCGSSGKTPAETGDETVAETATRAAVSINMWVVTDEKTTDEAKEQVEKALNEITKKRFTTYVDLMFFTKDEYAKALTDRFEAIENKVKEAEEEKKRQRAIEQSMKAAGLLLSSFFISFSFFFAPNKVLNNPPLICTLFSFFRPYFSKFSLLILFSEF